MERRDGTQIKFENQSKYDNFVQKLKSQLISFSNQACEENNVAIDSSDSKEVEAILMEVFMKYTLEFMRENMLVGGQKIQPSAEFSANGSKSQNNPDSTQYHLQLTQSKSGKRKVDKEPLTKPCDTSLNERVIRQQYALYDAAVGNTRKRKDLPVHIKQQVEQATKQAGESLERDVESIEEIEKERLSRAEEDPRQRYKVLNADLPNVERVQKNYRETNKIVSNLMESFPLMIENATRSIDLHKEIADVLYPSTQ
ncbi:hypothetical protein BY996DRAFT_4575093 [Phakopsora pachyrhizi]|uniref:Uncharacterized protein n=1 Tax=Phakopsora pachyrhizi TaxID=170000 RepID=A0AAV0BE89_PHAPC|nr:hypothetical protein BY996DRAFT_4575093 [Phakopsora pachyrhizi]CAH7685489.1 hypothetical protein PPACK8108_LOCUS20024 [Phakopsora pachyrhizi]